MPTCGQRKGYVGGAFGGAPCHCPKEVRPFLRQSRQNNRAAHGSRGVPISDRLQFAVDDFFELRGRLGPIQKYSVDDIPPEKNRPRNKRTGEIEG
jgi:hypothetical protein